MLICPLVMAGAFTDDVIRRTTPWAALTPNESEAETAHRMSLSVAPATKVAQLPVVSAKLALLVVVFNVRPPAGVLSPVTAAPPPSATEVVTVLGRNVFMV